MLSFLCSPFTLSASAIALFGYPVVAWAGFTLDSVGAKVMLALTLGQ